MRQNSHNYVILLWKCTLIHLCDLSLVWRFVLRKKITTHYCTPMYLLGHYVFFISIYSFASSLSSFLVICSLIHSLNYSLARSPALTLATNLKRLHIYSSGSRSLEFKFLGAETLTVDTGSDLDIKGQPDWYMYIFFLTLLRAWETWIGLLDYWTFGLWTIFGPFFTPFYNWGGVGGVMVAFAACRCTPLSTVYLFIIYSLTRAQVFNFNLLLFCIMCCLFHPFIVN